MRKKNLLLYGVFLGALSLSSCSNNARNKQDAAGSMSVKSAGEVMKYYNLSLKVLKDLVNEEDIKTILGYIDREGTNHSLPPVQHPVYLPQDTAFVANPGTYFGEEDCYNLAENYTRLFRSVHAFYENYDTYRLYMSNKEYQKDNYALAEKIRKEELLLSIALSEYKQVIFDILSPVVAGAKSSLAAQNKSVYSSPSK